MSIILNENIHFNKITEVIKESKKLQSKKIHKTTKYIINHVENLLFRPILYKKFVEQVTKLERRYQKKINIKAKKLKYKKFLHKLLKTDYYDEIRDSDTYIIWYNIDIGKVSRLKFICFSLREKFYDSDYYPGYCVYSIETGPFNGTMSTKSTYGLDILRMLVGIHERSNFINNNNLFLYHKKEINIFQLLCQQYQKMKNDDKNIQKHLQIYYIPPIANIINSYLLIYNF